MAVRPRQFVDGEYLTDTIQAFYTADSVSARIDAFALTNINSIPIKAWVHIVPDGGSAGNNNKVLEDFSIAAGQTLVPQGIVGQWVMEGGTIQAFASVTDSLALVASGVEYYGN